MNPKVKVNNLLWVIMVCHCSFIDYNKGTTSVGDVHSGGGCACVEAKGMWGISVHSSHFFWTKVVLKNKQTKTKAFRVNWNRTSWPSSQPWIPPCRRGIKNKHNYNIDKIFSWAFTLPLPCKRYLLNQISCCIHKYTIDLLIKSGKLRLIDYFLEKGYMWATKYIGRIVTNFLEADLYNVCIQLS